MQTVTEVNDKPLSPKELASIVDKHVNTVYNWINDGLPIHRCGKKGWISIYYREFKKWREQNIARAL